MPEAQEALKEIVRIANVDLDGTKAVHHQLTKIQGVGTSLANLLCNSLGIDTIRIFF